QGRHLFSITPESPPSAGVFKRRSHAVLMLTCGCNESVEPDDLTEMHLKDLGTLQFKEFPKGSEIEHAFQLNNTTNIALSLVDYKVSCACLEVLSPDSVAPGDDFQITLRFDARGLPEGRDEFVNFRTGNDQLPHLICRIQCKTVPNAVCEPMHLFNVKLDKDIQFELRGTYTAFVSTNEAQQNMAVDVVAAQAIKVELAKRGVAQIGDDLWAVRTPWIITQSTSFHLDHGDSTSFDVKFKSYDGCDKTVIVRVNRRSQYDLSPKQVFLPRELGNEIRITINGFRDEKLLAVQIDGERVERTNWSVNISNGSGFVTILPGAMGKLLEPSDDSGKDQTHILKLEFEQGVASIPVLIF
ncbi:MAG: DUF1573 domain-containing protein, partial [Planctomycetota bacterium]|nr:DUF1573 domain-containing protein [Planctomycetota bacterium]